MARTLLMALAVVTGLALSLGAAPAFACEAHDGPEAADGKAAKEGKAKDPKKKAAKVEEKKAVPSTPGEVKEAPAKEGSLLQELDEMIAAKCSCTSPADCTCKKGACKCSKCGSNQRSRMIESLKGAQDILRVPTNARRDATAGVFI